MCSQIEGVYRMVASENKPSNLHFSLNQATLVYGLVQWTTSEVLACKFMVHISLTPSSSLQDLLSSSHPSANWDSEHYATSLALYQSLGTKASGKPAFRLHQSRVGTVLIAR